MPDSDQKAEGAPAPLPTRRDPQAGRRPEHVAVGMFMFGARLGVQAGRVAILPWRAAGRLAGASRVDRAAGVLGADGRAASAQGRALIESAVDRTLAGPLPDTVAQKLVEHRVVERIVGDVMRQIDLDAVVTEILDDERTREQLERALANPALEKLAVSAIESKLTGEVTERLLASPQVHAALARRRWRASSWARSARSFACWTRTSSGARLRIPARTTAVSRHVGSRWWSMRSSRTCCCSFLSQRWP